MFLDRIRQWVNLLTAIGQIIVSAYVGRKIGEISGQYPNYVVPADYAFIIWNLIFALSLGYAVYQFLPSQAENRLLRETGWFSAAAFLANSVWMLIFSRKFITFSVFVIVAILLSLIALIVKIYRHAEKLSLWETRLVYVTFSIFFGWITVATVANTTVALVANKWDGFGVSPATWGVVMLLVIGFLCGAVVYLLRGNAAYAATVLWALFAVIVNQALGWIQTSSRQTIIAAIFAALLVASVLIAFRTKSAKVLLV